MSLTCFFSRFKMIPETHLMEKFFQKNEPTVDNIVRLAKFAYEKQCALHNRLLATDYFLRIIKTIAKHLKMKDVELQSLQFKLYDVIKSYRVRGGQSVRVAGLKDPLKIRILIKDLWFRTISKAIRPKPLSYQKILLRRITAIQTLLVSVTGRRWIDITRLRWEFAEIIHLRHATVIKIGIFISKPNKKGRRNESITLVKDNTELCPVKLLLKYWTLMGKPKTGWIFPCIHKNRVFKPNRFCPDWSDWCCVPGHRRGGKKIECLGNINGDVTEGMMKRAAKLVGFLEPPTKHTFRRILVVMATKLGMDRERICEHFGWNYDSHMISHYLQDALGTDKNGLPCKIASNMLNKDIFDDILIKE